MKNITTLLSLTFVFFSIAGYSQEQINGLFTDSVYSGYKVLSNVQYGSAYNYQTNVQENLLLDIYEPNVSTDYLRPVLIYVHGGGFTAGTKGGPGNVPIFASYFAPRGWLVASIDYRLGVEDPFTTTDNYEEAYEATQDAKASIRFFRRYASEYCVDTNAIYMTGVSAGGALSLTCAYWDQNEASPFVDVQKLGPLDQSSGNPGYSSNLKAIVNCWGGINDTAWLRNNNVPNYLFHGTDDPTVPYTSGYNANDIYIYGSYDIHEACDADGIESYLHPFYGAGHGVPDGSPQMDTVLMLSNSFLYAHLDTRLLSQASCGLANGILTPDSQNGSRFDIAPNPSNGSFSIKNNSSTESFKGTFELIDVSGRIVYSNTILINPSTSFSINLPGMQNGAYYAHFINSTEQSVEKVIILN